MFRFFFRKHHGPSDEPAGGDDRRMIALLNEAKTFEDLNVAIKMARMRRPV